MGEWWDEQLAGRPGSGLPAVRSGAGSPASVSAPAAGWGGGASNSARPARAVDEYGWWWAYARRCAAAFRAGVCPPEVQVFGPVLEADESALMSAQVEYSRLYGGDGRYDRSNFFIVDRPAVMVGGLALNAAINHHRKVVARREAVPKWRDRCLAAVIVTTHRLLCDAGGGWESFWYGAMSEFYPDLGAWSVTVGFQRCAALRLVGAAVPAVCLWMATAVLGDGWDRDPRLAGLLS